MTCEQFTRELERLRDQYAVDTQETGITPQRWDEITAQYWQTETELWETYTGRPHTRPRPRPH